VQQQPKGYGPGGDREKEKVVKEDAEGHVGVGEFENV
jgi:hypothetical protein